MNYENNTNVNNIQIKCTKTTFKFKPTSVVILQIKNSIKLLYIILLPIL